MKDKLSWRSQNGSAAIESIPVFLFSFTFASLLLFALYGLFAKTALNFYGEKSLICVLETGSARTCEKWLRQKVSYSLPLGKLIQLHLSGHTQQAWLSLRWRHHVHTVNIQSQIEARAIRKNKVLRF